MKKVLLFPGSFNPPHNGHVSILEVAVKQIPFEEVWIMPSGNRDDKIILTSYEDRLALGNIFIEHLQTKINIPVKLIDVELKDAGKRLTQEILKEIKSIPGIDITQLIGLDGYLSIQNKLTDVDERFVVINRQGYISPEDFIHKKDVVILDETLHGISSTRIRELIVDGDERYKEIIPERIAGYIANHNLYK